MNEGLAHGPTHDQHIQSGVGRVNLTNTHVEPDALELLPTHLMRSQKILPMSRTKNSVTVAVTDPYDPEQIEALRLYTGLQVVPLLASAEEVETAIRNALAYRCDPDLEQVVAQLAQSLYKEAADNRETKINIRDDAPIIRVVDLLLKQAVAAYSSDIHIEPQDDTVRVRFRVDGELYPVANLPKEILLPIISRLKIMAGLDIAEKRLPQDGRFQIKIDSREVDFRMSTLPTSFGEKAALRVLDKSHLITGLEHLGLAPANVQRLGSLSRRSQGMVLVTGATGSGKTTTLYAMLQAIDSNACNVITLEDPVEYSLPGINQVQINPKAGLDFTTGLGSILRQDPDIIMVGEIRDQATARLAVRAALTGHLVLSTLHTNSASAATARLVDMGIEPFLLGSALNGVVAQKLLRRLCENCRRPMRLDEDQADQMGIPAEAGNIFYVPSGCMMCRQIGYRGRVAVQEIMVAGAAVRQAIHRGVNGDAVQTAAVEDGMITIRTDALAKARLGVTSLAEVLKSILGD